MRTVMAVAISLAAISGCTAAPEDPSVALRTVDTTRASLLADLHAEREECKALGISLAAEPAEIKNGLVSECFAAYRASLDALSGTLQDLDRRIADLRKVVKPPV